MILIYLLPNVPLILLPDLCKWHLYELLWVNRIKIKGPKDPKAHLITNETNMFKTVEIGIDISNGKPENVNKYLEHSFDYVITVCGDAKETCPIFIGEVKEQLHIGFEDPADATGTDEEILSEFRRIRDEIKVDFLEWYIQLIAKTM